MRTLVPVAVLLALPLAVLAAGFKTNNWPGEGIPVLVAVNDGLELHSQPRSQSRAKRIHYRAGWRVPFDRSVLRTLRSTTILVQKQGSLEIWCDGLVKHNFARGEEIEYLQYRAEGHITARVQGKICEVPVYTEPEVFGSEIPEPKVEWWVRVVYEDGTSPGWLLVETSQIRFAGREF